MAYRTLLLTSPMQRGADVSALQNLVKAYDPAPGGAPFVDGVFGPNTRDALIAFQKSSLMPRELGWASPAFQKQFKLPEPATAVPTVSVETSTGGEPFVEQTATPFAKPTNWRLWLTLAGLGVVGYLATQKKNGWF